MVPPDQPELLDEVLQTFVEKERHTRGSFGTILTPPHPPFIGLLDLFIQPNIIQITRSRMIKDGTDPAFKSKYVMPLDRFDRHIQGSPSMTLSMAEFKENWLSFSEGCLNKLHNWDNILVAGGAISACLSPLPSYVNTQGMGDHYRETYPGSDVDLFLWGLTQEQVCQPSGYAIQTDLLKAEKKIVEIYEAVDEALGCKLTCVRTKHTLTIYGNSTNMS